MNFDQRVGEAKLNTPDQEGQEVKVVTENKPQAPESTIIGTSKDENFPGSTVFKVQDPDGKIKGYAIRTKEDGTFEGNDISYKPDGSMGTVQKLNEVDLAKLQQQGVIDEYKKQKNIESIKKMDEGKIKLMGLFLKGEHINPTYGITDNVAQMLVSDTKNYMNSLSPTEQENLAQEFYDSSIGKAPENNRDAYYVYLNFKGTPFGNKFSQLENQRLKEAGAGEFKL
jgi:hypothetical protein